MTTREGWRWRYQHVQAIIVAIGQYAEGATGDREFFLNGPRTLAKPCRATLPNRLRLGYLANR
jgi:hypothetical protein